MLQCIPRRKRAFDLIVGLCMAISLLPVMTGLAACVLIVDGRPIFYQSRRRTDLGPARTIIKFRTMRRDADRVANRDTLPIEGTRFLNLPRESPLYTPIGRLIERLMMTEMPQLLHVLQGRMSIIGNRPLPDNVVRSLSEEFPQTEQRFLVHGGLTGPVQLVGRDRISDGDRLKIEIAYCEAVLRSYSVTLDLMILVYTIFGGFFPRFQRTPEAILALIDRHGGAGSQRPIAPPEGRLEPMHKSVDFPPKGTW